VTCCPQYSNNVPRVQLLASNGLLVTPVSVACVIVPLRNALRFSCRRRSRNNRYWRVSKNWKTRYMRVLTCCCRTICVGWVCVRTLRCIDGRCTRRRLRSRAYADARRRRHRRRTRSWLRSAISLSYVLRRGGDMGESVTCGAGHTTLDRRRHS
jgi:hypothetical protein